MARCLFSLPRRRHKTSRHLFCSISATRSFLTATKPTSIDSTMRAISVFAFLVVALAVGMLSPSASAAPSPFQGGVGGSPGGARPDNQRHGQVGGGVQRDKGVGTSVHVHGSGDAWVSRDGNSRVAVDGRYGQVVHGPMRGQKDYGANVRFEHRF